MRNAFVLFLLLVSGSVFAQSSLHKKAARKFERFEFVTAAKLYEKIVHENPNDEFAQTRLDQCYNALNFQTLKVHQAIQKKSEQNNRATPDVNLPAKRH